MDKLKIITRIENVEMTAKEYIGFCKKIILGLKNKHPDFKNLSTWDDDSNASYYFKDDLSDFNEQNLLKIIMKDKEIAYQNNHSDDKDLHIGSKSWIGFSSTFSFGETNREYYDIAISINQGSCQKDKFGLINFEFSDRYQTKLSSDLLKTVINALIDNTNLKYAVVISDGFRKWVRNQDYKLWIGWITYVDNKKIFTALPNDISKEYIGNGVLFSLCDNSPNPEDKYIIDKAIRIREIIGRMGYLNYPFQNN